MRRARAKPGIQAQPWLIAAALATAYLIVRPVTADLAAQVYRTGLFERYGFTVWNGAWYGGHHTPGYSVLFPPLAALTAPRVVGVAAALAAAVLFGRIARAHWGERAWLGAAWFAAATATNLFTGRLTFALGVALALGAVLAAQRERRGAALALALLTPLASPVAGLFLALGAVAHAAGERSRSSAWLAAAAFAPALVLALLFPEGGSEPFVASAFWPVVAFGAAALVLLPREERALRVGVALYVVSAAAAFAIATPMGGNATRLGMMLGGPLLACVLWRRRPLALALVALPLLWWQWAPPVRDVAGSTHDASLTASYFAPLNRFLAAQHGPPGRVEVTPTRNKWEAAYVADRFPLARGWERQLDRKYAAIFYRQPLTAAAYRAWLDAQAVRWVAVPDAPLDYAARAEARLVRGGLPYLRPVFHDAHWRVYAVRDPAPMVAGGAATLVGMGPEGFELHAARAGSVVVRVRFTPYWKLTAGRGCVEATPGGLTRVTLAEPGTAVVRAAFAASRVLHRGRRCSGTS